MAQVQALSGIRYDLTHVGDLSDVVAPPYDVIDPQLQNKLYDRNPYNVVRLILNRSESGEATGANHARAARLWTEWNRGGILARDKTPAIYVYHQEFNTNGQTIRRRGYLARLRLEPFGKGSVYPHEETHSRVREDRLQLLKACRANLSPIFGLFPDAQNEVQSLLESYLEPAPPWVATDPGGVVHKMWSVTDEPTIARVSGLMAQYPIFVADGHHRYESACAYRDYLAASQPLDAQHPANFVLMTFVSMSDPGLLVLPTHRLFRGVPQVSVMELLSKLEPAMTVRATEYSRRESTAVWREVLEGDSTTVGLYSDRDDRWCLADLTPAGHDILRGLTGHHSDDWRNLGVSVLHELVIKHLLKLTDLPSPRYVHSVEEVEAALRDGDAPGRDATGQMGTTSRFELAALVRPATVEDIQRISTHGERMPAKSTYFYPKLLSGLVFNSLE